MANENLSVNVLLGTKITLFKREFVVVLSKEDDGGYSFLLAPTKTQIEGITLKEMTDEIEKIFGETPNMDQLTKITEGKNNVKFNLAMAYYYMKTVKNGTDETKEVQFAFQVTATGLENLIPSGLGDIFSVDKVNLAIWSKNVNTNIIKAMQLYTPKEYFNELEAQKN